MEGHGRVLLKPGQELTYGATVPYNHKLVGIDHSDPSVLSDRTKDAVFLRGGRNRIGVPVLHESEYPGSEVGIENLVEGIAAQLFIEEDVVHSGSEIIFYELPEVRSFVSDAAAQGDSGSRLNRAAALTDGLPELPRKRMTKALRKIDGLRNMGIEANPFTDLEITRHGVAPIVS
jgi:hypothetical protein